MENKNPHKPLPPLAPPEKEPTVADVVAALLKLPQDLPVYGPGFLRDAFGENLMPVRFKIVECVEYTCSGGHVGDYEVIQKVGDRPPDYAHARSESYPAVVTARMMYTFSGRRQNIPVERE